MTIERAMFQHWNDIVPSMTVSVLVHHYALLQLSGSDEESLLYSLLERC